MFQASFNATRTHIHSLITDYYKRGLPTVEFSVAVSIEDNFMRKHSISLAMAHHQQQQQLIHELYFLLFFFSNEKFLQRAIKIDFFLLLIILGKLNGNIFLFYLSETKRKIYYI